MTGPARTCRTARRSSLDCPRIRAHYEIEAEIRGQSSDERRAVRQVRAGPVIKARSSGSRIQLRRVSGRSAIAEAMRYGLSRWDGLTAATSTTPASRSPPTW